MLLFISKLVFYYKMSKRLQLSKSFAWDLLDLEIELEMTKDLDILKNTINEIIIMYTVIIYFAFINTLSFKFIHLN